jgi:hypothetical protein
MGLHVVDLGVTGRIATTRYKRKGVCPWNHRHLQRVTPVQKSPFLVFAPWPCVRASWFLVESRGHHPPEWARFRDHAWPRSYTAYVQIAPLGVLSGPRLASFRGSQMNALICLSPVNLSFHYHDGQSYRAVCTRTDRRSIVYLEISSRYFIDHKRIPILRAKSVWRAMSVAIDEGE